MKIAHQLRSTAPPPAFQESTRKTERGLLPSPDQLQAQPSVLDLPTLRQSAGSASRLLKTLANPDRLLLLCQLSQGEKSVGELEALVGIGQPTLSQQLGVLREEGLVSTRREGKHIHYTVTSPQALAILDVLYQQFCSS